MTLEQVEAALVETDPSFVEVKVYSEEEILGAVITNEEGPPPVTKGPEKAEW